VRSQCRLTKSRRVSGWGPTRGSAGNNGYIWIGAEKDPKELAAEADSEDASLPSSARVVVGKGMREKIARVRNVVLALASQRLAIFVTTIIYAYEDSEHHDVKALCSPEIAAEVTARARAACLTT